MAYLPNNPLRMHSIYSPDTVLQGVYPPQSRMSGFESVMTTQSVLKHYGPRVTKFRKEDFLPVHNLSDIPVFHTMSMREKMDNIMTQTPPGALWDIFQIILSIVSCCLYVYSTYLESDPYWLWVFEIVLASLFLLDYIMQVYVAEHRIRFILSWRSAVDVLTILPVFIGMLMEDDDAQSLFFLRVLRLFRLLRIMRIYRIFNLGFDSYNNDSVRQQVVVLVITLLSLVFCAAGFTQMAENRSMNPNEDGYLSFHNAIYFIVVTVATVGYGDIVMTTVLGRMFIVIFILATAMIIPIQSHQLVKLMNLHSSYSGEFHPHAGWGHVVTTMRTSMEGMTFFLREFFSSSHGHHRIKMLIMNPQSPSRKMKMILKQRDIGKRLQYLEGTTMGQRDLVRCKMEKSAGFFVLSRKAPKSHEAEDSVSILQVLSAKSYDPGVEIFVQVHLPQNASQVRSVGADHVLCIREFIMNLLAANCRCPGLGTLLTNLWRNEVVEPGATTEVWLNEYLHGMTYEVYPIRLGHALHRRSFADCVRVVFHEFGIFLFAIKRYRTNERKGLDAKFMDQKSEDISDSTDFEMLIAPRPDLLIMEGDVGFVLAQSAEHALKIPNLQIPDVIDIAHSFRLDPHMAFLGKVHPYSTTQIVHVPPTLSSDGIPLSRPSTSWEVEPKKWPERLEEIDAIPTGKGSHFHLSSSFLSSVGQDPTFEAAQYVVDHAKLNISAHNLSSSFRLSQNKEPLENVIMPRIPTHIHNHVIVCGELTSIEHFLLPLRQIERSEKSKSPQEPEKGDESVEGGHDESDWSDRVVVLLTDDPLTDIPWEDGLCYIPDVLVVQGSAKHVSDLRRCGIERASRVVCLTPRRTYESGIDDYMVDFESILVHHEVFCQFPHVESTVELVYGTSMSYLVPRVVSVRTSKAQSIEVADPFLAAAFASGRVITNMILDSLLCQSFFNPSILPLMGLLVSSVTSFPTDRAANRGFLWHMIDAPDEFVDKPFSFFFHDCVVHGHGIPVGIRRAEDHEACDFPFVFSCPPGDAIVHPGDQFYILRMDAPGLETE
eukprot:TRINITY_DN7481_c0_g1_i1.p1 TRINITY_DN7481_c0_g1~~TRINITY_DN7481_c0_g1_i1.p1  ORF type:complete len:1050 (-),score=218.87 TRINITY_DN7481_c0_g1_i1:1823-4972(-)